jgi:predicted lactoylglutathione lyase
MLITFKFFTGKYKNMKPRISVITLGVKNLERSLVFYRDGLGLETEGVVGAELDGYAVAFFKLEGGLVLGLWASKHLASDAKIPHMITNSSAFSIGHNVKTREEVDEVMKRAEMAGAQISDPPSDRPWGGYSGYFKDLDEHLWDVVWNPQLLPET